MNHHHAATSAIPINRKASTCLAIKENDKKEESSGSGSIPIAHWEEVKQQSKLEPDAFLNKATGLVNERNP